MSSTLPLWILPALPLAGAAVLGSISLASTKSVRGAHEGITGFLAVLFPVLAFIATVLFSIQVPQGQVLETTLGTWFAVPGLDVQLGFLLDGLSRIMLLFVTGIGSLIVLYSTGYMHGDRGYVRFMAYLQLFLFSMVVLVLSNSLPLTFLGWEGVGLCSYLLIGFWHQDPENCKAANKAFIVNRVGDVGFLLGMFTLVSLGGSGILHYTELSAWLASAMAQGVLENATVQVLVALAGLLLFFGCTGKSAQIPLLTWLPDAMAGPTPVSALIHAATMVTSGVYLLARLSDLFVLSPLVLTVITTVGLATALWAAIAGLVQDDIKKVLAYSTVSQLGFMFMAAGVAAFDVAIFHVFTHAFFKAALFLGAGSVIHALGGEQDLRKMGGLARKLPSTFLIMALAWAAIIGLPGFAGFWSKDMILERLYVSGPLGPIYYGIALATAILTAVYMTRMMVLTFAGSFRGSIHSYEHAHESPASMQVPMWILAIGSVLAGYLWAGLIPGWNWFEHNLHSVVGKAQHLVATHGTVHVSPWLFAVVGSAVAVVGACVGAIVYLRRTPRVTGAPGPYGWAKTWTFAWDSLHRVLGILPVRLLAFVAEFINRFLMAIQWTLSQFPSIFGEGLKGLQTGRVRRQMAWSLLGTLVLTIVLVWGVR